MLCVAYNGSHEPCVAMGHLKCDQKIKYKLYLI